MSPERVTNREVDSGNKRGNTSEHLEEHLDARLGRYFDENFT
jgi:hypothetical protein